MAQSESVQVLTEDAIKKAVIRYYKAGKLGFQKNKNACLYRYDDGSRCAIGAALNGPTLRKAMRHAATGAASSVTSLIKEGIVAVDCKQTMQFAQTLQQQHDGMCGGRPAGPSAVDIADFEAMIGIATPGPRK